MQIIFKFAFADIGHLITNTKFSHEIMRKTYWQLVPTKSTHLLFLSSQEIAIVKNYWQNIAR